MLEETYKLIYEQVRELSIAEALQLIRNAETDEEKSFYACLLNWHFQRKQKIAIEKNLF